MKSETPGLSVEPEAPPEPIEGPSDLLELLAAEKEHTRRSDALATHGLCSSRAR